MSRARQIQKAVRKGKKARVALAGPAGAGKTYSALIVAKTLAPQGKILVIDTERGSAGLYSDQFEFETIDWLAPYDPIELAQDLKALSAQYDVIIVDSLTHFWQGEGGTLDMVDAAGERAKGNRFAGWKVGTPAQNGMIDAMLAASCHVIATMRSKMEYVQEKDGNGRTIIKKVGMQPIQREGVEFEFTVTADLDVEHRLSISKSRCEVIADRVYPKGQTDKMAIALKEWLEGAQESASNSVEPEEASKLGSDGASDGPVVESEGETSPVQPSDSSLWVDEFTIVAWRNVVGSLDPVRRDQVRKRWMDEYGSLAKGQVKAHYQDEIDKMIGTISADMHEKNRKLVNLKMKEVGISTDDARHELIAKATKGAKKSSARLSAAEATAVLEEIEALRLADGAA